MTPTLEQLYEMQKELDAKIIAAKGLEGQDLLPNTVLALQVELGELANEWRGFKHWSKNQQPRHEVKCHACAGRGWFDLSTALSDEKEPCAYCDGTGVQRRPLLEEYVDCLHFVLSICRQLEFKIQKYSHDDLTIELVNITEAFNHTFNWAVSVLYMAETGRDTWKSMVRLLDTFFSLGKMLGLTWKQIAAAYIEKNKTNHERQANGY